jgi:hypothetical protein
VCVCMCVRRRERENQENKQVIHCICSKANSTKHKTSQNQKEICKTENDEMIGILCR